MMTYEKWRGCIASAAENIASREFQEEAWFAEGKVVSSPDEVYQVLIGDCTADLFFETYGSRLSEPQIRCWRELRSLLEAYYDKLATVPDPRQILDDPHWDLVRQSANRFIGALNERDQKEVGS